MNSHSTSCRACNRPVMVRYMYQETSLARAPPRKQKAEPPEHAASGRTSLIGQKWRSRPSPTKRKVPGR